MSPTGRVVCQTKKSSNESRQTWLAMKRIEGWKWTEGEGDDEGDERQRVKWGGGKSE